MPTFASDTLQALIHAVCTAGGSHEREADLVADQLVEANLTGHDSHGVGLLPYYVQSLANGALVPNRHAEPVQRPGFGPGGRGPARLRPGDRPRGDASSAWRAPATRASPCWRSATASTSAGSVIGPSSARAGGFASIHFVNGIDHPPIQAPFGSAQSRLSTNPFCAALPGPDGALVVLDMATSKIALGKARVAANHGVPVPEGSLLDAHGRPTRRRRGHVPGAEGRPGRDGRAQGLGPRHPLRAAGRRA